LERKATIKEAAEEFGIKFSTSKAILSTFRKEGRVGKKKTRSRRSFPELPDSIADEQQQQLAI
jgi:transposase